ncbi:MAG TPA: hypothetical protein VFS34_16215 [Thermoanaerobaculia bacterium]|nr:hypothetical protein [Thermoanaerobaculia bacterium]
MRLRPLLASTMLLFLTGCFTVIVQHTSVAHGRIEKGPAEAYVKSPDSVIDVRSESSGVSPKVTVKVTADSSEGLKRLHYEVLKGDRTIASESKSATETTDAAGAKKWSTHLDMPAVLDLAGTSDAPLLLRVTAEQQDGTIQVIAARYRALPPQKDAGKGL